MEEKIDLNGDAKFLGYAPVIIPTLNRYEHFKRCLESLERCTGADKTDVYIGLDYPPSEKYVEGWKKIDLYLNKKEGNNGFRNLFVRRRDHNCGIGKKGSNIYLLRIEVTEFSDSYIMSEDDNEFSPNFLEYMNYGLQKYRDRQDVMLICGYLFPDLSLEIKETNAFLASFSNAYGAGYWAFKRYDYHKVGGKIYVEDVLRSWKLSWKLFLKRSSSLNGFLSMHFRGQYYGDVLKTSEMLLTNKYSLFPSISKVRNWGHDGSGVHCAVSDKYIHQEIDCDEKFEFSGNVPKIEVLQKLDFGIAKRLVILIRYVGFRITGKDWMSIYWKLK